MDQPRNAKTVRESISKFHCFKKVDTALKIPARGNVHLVSVSRPTSRYADLSTLLAAPPARATQQPMRGRQEDALDLGLILFPEKHLECHWAPNGLVVSQQVQWLNELGQSLSHLCQLSPERDLAWNRSDLV